ncbi:MAG: hypothetical protein NTW19_13125 [Planctomycetota bacterium]|nr:hypothetical protein [Planctomycetota bacterium]
MASLPWPRAEARDVSLDLRPTFVQPLGQWPGLSIPAPRRLLLTADGGNFAPDSLTLGASAPAPAAPPPTAHAELLDRCTEQGFMWEQHLLRIAWGGRSVGVAMGLRHAGEVHWWEGCRLVVLERKPTCLVVEMGGAIPRVFTSAAELRRIPSYNNPYLHTHNWINGRIHARLHANGVCEIFAHHINSRFFDDGLHLEDVVPVIGLVTDAPEAQAEAICGPWRGDRAEWTLGSTRFDMAEAARLATPEQPGRIDRVGKILAWQPYEGAELYGGICPRQRTGDPFLFRSSQRCFPRGMARTVRFTLSLSDRSPRVARYVAPAWWYGLCEEFDAAPLLPVSNEYDRRLDSARDWSRRAIHNGGFEDGALARSINANPDSLDRGRSEPGWEGEAPHALFMLAWRSADPQLHADAMRAAYYFTDVAIDHAAKMVRMHGYPPFAFSNPMNRVQAPIAAYLECGDPYLVEAAQAVIDNAHWTQKNSWPRMAVGRDAKYVRGAVMLHRYLGDEHYRRIAHEGAMAAAESQRENGSFGDQAGGTGIHQWGAYITKPWMGLMATEGMLDYLDLLPGDAMMLACVRRFGDWLMRARYDHNGVMGWGYQHDFNGEPRHWDFYTDKWIDLPGVHLWHQDSLGRLLGACTLESGDPSYLDAWAESFAKQGAVGGDHDLTTVAQSIPWIQSRLWRATPSPSGVRVKPLHFGPRTPAHASIMAPSGPVAVHWNSDGRVHPRPGVEVT